MSKNDKPCIACASAYLRGEDRCPICGIPVAVVKLREPRKFNRSDLFDPENEAFGPRSLLSEWDNPLILLVVVTVVVVSSVVANIVL
jgi:hypothetical protein